MGKRVDFSARTVITGDPNLNVNQVKISKHFDLLPQYITFNYNFEGRNSEEHCLQFDLSGNRYRLQHRLSPTACQPRSQSGKI